MARPKEGYYLRDGVTKVPGTTTITGRFKDSGALISWAAKMGWEQGRAGKKLDIYADKAADIGTYVHTLVEAHLKNLEPPTIPAEFTTVQQQQAMDGYGAFREWERQSGLEIVSFEEPLVSEEYQYGGTIDALFRINGKLAIGDWKASAGWYSDYLLQLVAYRRLWLENHPDQPLNGIHLCRFDKFGGGFEHRYFPESHPLLPVAWRQFQLLREAYEIDRLLKKGAS